MTISQQHLLNLLHLPDYIAMQSSHEQTSLDLALAFDSQYIHADVYQCTLCISLLQQIECAVIDYMQVF